MWKLSELLHNLKMFLLLLCMAAMQLAVWANGIQYYYITASKDQIFLNDTCNSEGNIVQPCFTLEMMRDQLSSLPAGGNTSIIFLSNNYSIKYELLLKFTSLNKLELRSWRGDTSATITCAADMSILFFNVRTVIISSVHFHYCGKLKTLLRFLDSSKAFEMVTIVNSEFIGNKNGSIHISHGIQNLSIINCLFEGNSYGIHGKLSSNFSGHIKNTDFIDNYNNSIKLSSNAYDITLTLNVAHCKFINNTPLLGDTNIDANGGAIVLVSLKDVYIRECIFLNNTSPWPGAAIYYDITNIFKHGQYDNKCTLSIVSCNFMNNMATYGGAVELYGYKHFTLYNSTFIGNRAMEGGAIELTPLGEGYIIKCTFSQNFADIGGAIGISSDFEDLIVLSKLQNLSTLTIESSDICNNMALRGGAVSIRNQLDSEILIRDCIIVDNEAEEDGAAIAVVGYLTIVNNEKNLTKLFILNSSFVGNQGKGTQSCGGALYQKTPFILQLTSTSFIKNKAFDGGALCFRPQAQLVDAKHIQIENCTFKENEACNGGAVYTKDIDIYVTNLSLVGNSALNNGGGIALIDASLVLSGILDFSDNLAKSYGGAIYVKNDKDCSLDAACSISVYGENEFVIFNNNSAEVGPVIYGGRVDKCTSNEKEHMSSFLDSVVIDNSRYSYTSHTITSAAVKFCYCWNHIPDCSLRNLSRTLFPGQALEVEVACVDLLEQPIPCNIKSDYSMNNIEIGQQDQYTCQNLKFRIFSKHNNTSALLSLKAGLYCSESARNTVVVNINIMPCPVGFQNVKNQCECDNRLKETFDGIICDIKSNSIILKQLGWFSYNDGYLRAHQNCPLNYCSNRKNKSAANFDTQCENNHEGILCGKCVTNHSVVLGSWKCMKCSHLSKYNFIWLTVVIALAGVVLVMFLLLVKMTVSSGTINGLIFYANILSFSGLLDYHTCSMHPILRVFLLWINLDFGIEVCFCSGMDVYQKTWLQFVFTFYIWFLVGVIILFCHYSSTVMKLMGMRNIEVLATLFLLSYAKLLKTIVTALSFTDIMVASADNVSDLLTPQRVWVYDGSIEYGVSKHLPLLVMSLLFLLLLFFPYTFLLIFGQCLRSLPHKKGFLWFHSTVFTTIMDVYHAPYTKHHRYWTGLGLLIRCLLFAIFCISDGVPTNLMSINTAVIFLLAIRLFSCNTVYQSRLAGSLELLFLSNLGILAVILLFSSTRCEVLNVSVSISFIAFVFMIIYHVHIELIRNIPMCNTLMESIKDVIFKRKLQPLKEEGVVEAPQSKDLSKYSTTYLELREKLIDN